MTDSCDDFKKTELYSILENGKTIFTNKNVPIECFDKTINQKKNYC